MLFDVYNAAEFGYRGHRNDDRSASQIRNFDNSLCSASNNQSSYILSGCCILALFVSRISGTYEIEVLDPLWHS